MLNFGNKEFRNLQEQVLKNAQDIETLKGRENLQIVIVEELPEEGNPDYIYLVAKDDGESPDVYDEYIWLEDEERYEKIGGVSIDLTNYVTLDSAQTITAAKKITSTVTFDENGEATYPFIITPYATGAKLGTSAVNDIVTIAGYNTFQVRGAILPRVNNTYDLGASGTTWKDVYVSGTIYLNYAKVMADANYFRVNSSVSDATIIYANTQNVNTRSIRPLTTNAFDLGSSTLYWQHLYLTGNISDGANTVSVANIASKATSTFISGTFDSNGESTIDTEQAGTPEGLFIFTYGNCQCFLRLTATMVQNADTTPIRVACPMIYNSGTVNGWLNITKSGYILILKITDGTNHVDSGYGWTLTKTNLI